MRFVSFDSSTTSSGCCLWINGELKEYKTLVPKKKSPAEDRIYEMAQLITDTLNEWKPEMIYAETPQGRGGNVKLARQLGEILGVIMGWAASHNCTFDEVNPSWWRKWNFWEQGNLKREELKSLSINKAKELYGIECGDDLADAIHIGKAAINYYESLEI